MNDQPKLVPREDFARFLDSQEHAALLSDYLVSRLPVPSTVEAYERFELIAYMRIYHGYSERDMERLIPARDESPDLQIAGLRDKETGAMYDVVYGARYLFEDVDDFESAGHQETPLLDELHSSVSHGIAALAKDAEAVSKAIRAAEEAGYAPYYRRTGRSLARRVATVYAKEGWFDCDLLDELVRTCSPEHYWAVDLMDSLVYGDEAPKRRVEEFLVAHEAEFGTAMLDLGHWSRIIGEHGDAIEQALKLNRSIRSALEPLGALSVHLVFDCAGKEVDLTAKTSKLLDLAKRPTPMTLVRSDVIGYVPDELMTGKGGRKLNLAALKAIRFRGRDAWTPES